MSAVGGLVFGMFATMAIIRKSKQKSASELYDDEVTKAKASGYAPGKKSELMPMLEARAKDYRTTTNILFGVSALVLVALVFN